MSEDAIQSSSRTRTRSASRRGRTLVPHVPDRWLILAVPVLIILLLLTINLEQRLPAVRVPKGGAGQSAQRLLPGTWSILDVPVRTTGTWFQQPLENDTSLATDQPGNALEIHFFGTRLEMRARIGPESGDVYVQIDGQPVGRLLQDDQGSYVDLSAQQAQDEEVVLASGLSHEEHVLRLTNGPDGQFAISAVSVEAQTPFPWAFAAFYGFLIIVLFITVRALSIRYANRHGWLLGPADTDVSLIERR